MPRVSSRALLSTLGPLPLYGLLSLVFFGRPLAHGNQEYVGFSYDPLFSVWSLAWWPHAILNGENPFVTRCGP